MSEKGRRKWAGFQAQRLGHGGKTLVHQATALDYKTIKRGIKEIEEGDLLELGRIRQPGGGQKCLTRLYPNLSQDLEMLLEDSTRGDPENPLKWTSKSTLKLCQALFSFISANWRGKLLIDRATVVSLIANTTTKTGLKIQAKLDERNYQTGIKVSDQEMKLLTIKLASKSLTKK